MEYDYAVRIAGILKGLDRVIEERKTIHSKLRANAPVFTPSPAHQASLPPLPQSEVSLPLQQCHPYRDALLRNV